MMNLSKYLLLIPLAALIAVSCNPAKKMTQDKPLSIPATYGDGAYTADTLLAARRDFFKDAYLSTLIDTAINNNYDLRIALQRIRVAGSNVLLSKGAYKPFVKGMGAAGITRYGDYTMDGAGNIGTPIYDGRPIPKDLPDYMLGLQTSWEVDVWGKLRNKKKAALSRFLASVEGKNLILTGIIADVAITYYELLAFDNRLDIINETITLQEDALEIVKVQKEAAMANQLAVEQFEAQLLALKSMRFETLQHITEHEARINLLLGRFPQPVARNKNSLTQSLPLSIMNGIPYKLLQARPDIRQAEAELTASKADVRAAKAAFYPSLNITGGVGFRAFLPGLLFNTPEAVIYNILGSIGAPLFNRSILKAELGKANATQKEALLHYEKTVTNGYTEVYVQLSKMRNMRRAFDFKKQQVAMLTNSIETSSVLFKTGRSSYLEILMAQQNALRAKLELIDTRKELFNTHVNIYKALGGGWR